MSVVLAGASSDTEADSTGSNAPGDNSRSGPLRRLWPDFRPYRRALYASALLPGFGMLCDLLVPVLTARIVDGPVARRDFGGIWGPVLLVAVLSLLSTATSWLRRWVIAHPAAQLEVRLRARLFRRLQILSVGVHDGMESGQLTSRAITDMSTLRRFFAFVAPTLVALSMTLAAGVLILFAFAWQIGLVELLIAVPLVLLALRFEQEYGRASRRAQDQSGDLATTVEESAQGIRVLKAFGRGLWFGGRFRRQARELQRLEMDKVRLAARLWTALNTLSTLSIAAALAIGGFLLTSDTMTLGTLVAGITLATYLQWPIMGIGFVLAEMNQARTAAERYWEIIDTPVEIADPARPVPRRGHCAVNCASTGSDSASRTPNMICCTRFRCASGRGDGRDRRCHRERQNRCARAGSATVRRLRRFGHRRRRRHPLAAAGGSALDRVGRVRGAGAVLGERAREHHARVPRRDRRPGPRRARRRLRHRIRGQPALGAAYPHR